MKTDVADSSPVVPLACVSMSGGKDSTATALLCIERVDAMHRAFVFADTGNEHEAVYEYLDYLQRKLGITIARLRRDFSPEWWHRRDYVRDEWAAKGVPQSDVDRVLAVFERGPTGNPYLDLCIIKGRFPSRKMQFCTQFLKTEPLVEYQMTLCGQGFAVESWQGIRADESASRARRPEREDVGDRLSIYRPILRWTVEDVFALHERHGVEPNPLYRMGMRRVGCMPCINASKDEVLEISKRFPAHIDRIAEWEAIVSEGSKRGDSSFFPDPDRDASLNKRGIRNIVEWASTARGGRQLDFVRMAPALACASSYGLCE